MFVFGISRGINNLITWFMYPRQRFYLSLAALSVLLMVGFLMVIIPGNAAALDMTVLEYLQTSDSSLASYAFTMLCIGALPPMVMGLASLQRATGPRIGPQFSALMETLGLKKQVLSKVNALFEGEVEGRRTMVTVYAPLQRQATVVTVPPQPATLFHSVVLRVNAEHRGEMALHPESMQFMRLPPHLKLLEPHPILHPGARLLARDVEWSRRLLMQKPVAGALERLRAAAAPHQNWSIGLENLGVVMVLRFDPLVTGAVLFAEEQVRQMLADLRVLAEAAETQPAPHQPAPDDLTARMAADDPAGMARFPIALGILIAGVIMLMLALGSLLR